MINTRYISLEKEVFLSETEKNSPEYFKAAGDMYISAFNSRRLRVEMDRNYYSSVRDEEDFEYLEDIYGMQNPIDIGFTNIIKPRVDALIGLSLLSEPLFSVAYLDSDTIEAVKKEKLEKVAKEVTQKINESFDASKEPQPVGKNEVSEGLKDWLAKTNKKYGDNYVSSYDIAAQNIINIIEKDSEIDLPGVKKDLSKNYFTTGEGYVRSIYKGEGRDPKIVCIDPEEIFTNKPRGDRNLNNTDVVVRHQRMTIHNVLKELGEVITKKEAEELFSTYTTLGNDILLRDGAKNVNLTYEGSHEMDQADIKTGYSNDNSTFSDDLVDFYHVEWLASTRIKGENGYVYREDRYEVFRVGPSLYIRGRRCDEAPRSKECPWKTTLSYKGLINTSPKGAISSVVGSMRELQDLYDIMMFFRNNTVANSGVSGSRVNVAAIPKALGKKFMSRLTKWITFRKQGIELIDPTEEGANLFQHYGDFDASVNGNSINAINTILESLTIQADIVSNVPRQMLGVIEQRDAVENVKVGINQVSVLSLEMFKDIDKCLNSVVQETLDNFKHAYREIPKKGVIKHGNIVAPFIVNPSKFSFTDHKVSVVSAGIENPKLLKVLGLANNFVAAGAIPAEVMVKLVNKRSVKEIEHILNEAILEKKEEMISIQKMQQALDDAEKTINQMEAEINRLKNNASAHSKEKLELDKKIASYKERDSSRSLDIQEEKIEKESKQKDKELKLKAQTVELEREELLFGAGNSKEINNS